MKVTKGKINRVFVLRLEDGDKLPDCIEIFAQENQLSVGMVFFLGGVSHGSVVVGPANAQEMPPSPIQILFRAPHEILGIGLIVPDETGVPLLHMHASLGRRRKVITGCIRPGIYTWLVGEVIIIELAHMSLIRATDNISGFKLLEVK